MLEREVKLAFRDAQAARAAVVSAGASPLRCRRLQEDALFDTTDESLRRRGCALRVRIESGRSLVTFKGPVQPAPMNAREEHETVVGDGEAMLQVFDALGLRPWFRYQKYREDFAAENVTIAIDETPVGTFVEIEGGEEEILAMTRAMGRTADDFILDSYYSLFRQRREALGLPGRDMVFAGE